LTSAYGNLTLHQCCGSGDPCPCLMDPEPDPPIYTNDLQNANGKNYFFLLITVHYYHFSKIKCHKEVKKQ
jgi:hypothetical protein